MSTLGFAHPRNIIAYYLGLHQKLFRVAAIFKQLYPFFFETIDTA